MTPKEYKEMMAYLTRSGIKDQVKFASDIGKPVDKFEVQQIKLFNEFNTRNPRTGKAGGGMLVQPGFGGVRQGYAAPLNLKRNIEQIKKTKNPELKNKFGFRTMYDIPEGTPGYLGKAGERAVFNTKADAERFVKEDFPKIVSPSRTDETNKTKIKELFKKGKTNQQVATALKTNVTTVKRIKKDLGLDVVKKKQLEGIKQKFLKLKDLAEETNKGFKYVQMKDLLEQVGLRGNYSPSDVKNFTKYNIPKLESAQDKVRKAFKFLTSNPNKPVEELFSFNSQIAKLTGTNQNTVSTILSDLPEYQEFKPIMNKLIIPASRARLTGKDMVLADLIEEVENVRPTGGGDILRSARNTPEYFIMENAKRHVNQGGTKVIFTRMPGDLDDTGKLISTTDAEFIYKGKKYTYDDLLRTGRKNFSEVYKVFDDLDELLDKPVIHPLTKQKINFSTLMKEAYNKGAGYGYDRIPYAIDHFKQVKEEPFTNLRVTSARLNSSAGVIKQKEFQAKQGAFGEEKTKLYSPENVKKNLKKMGYDFTKDINKLFEDEIKLANDILVKKRVLKKPIQIAQEYQLIEGQRLKSPSGSGAVTLGALDVPSMFKRLSPATRKLVSGFGGAILPEVFFYQLDKRNRMSKGQSEKEAAAGALESGTLGAYDNKAYMEGLKETAKSMGVDSNSFDSAYQLNLLTKNYEQNNFNYERQYLNLLEAGEEKRAEDLKKNFDRYTKETQNKYALLSNNISDNVMNTVGASPLIMKEGRENITQQQFEKPFFDMQDAAMEKLKREKQKAFPTQSRQVDTAAGSVGEGFYKAFDSLTQGAKNLLQGRTIPFGPDRLRPLESEREQEARFLKEMDPRELFLYNKARGITYDQPITSADFENLKYENPGLFAGGGIAKLAGVSSGPPPESGPNSQGLQGLMKRVRNR